MRIGCSLHFVRGRSLRSRARFVVLSAGLAIAAAAISADPTCSRAQSSDGETGADVPIGTLMETIQLPPSLPANSLPSPSDDFSVGRGQLTFDQEGTESPGRFFSRRPTVPGNNSGVTVGRGYDVKSRSPAEVRSDLIAAGLSPAQADAYAGATGLAGANAKAYLKSHSLAELTPAQQKALFERAYSQAEDSLRRAFPGFDNFPQPAQEALTDMAYNLGTSKLLNGFPNLFDAVRRQDWQSAADESHRKGISESRNDGVSDLFESAAADAADENDDSADDADDDAPNDEEQLVYVDDPKDPASASGGTASRGAAAGAPASRPRTGAIPLNGTPLPWVPMAPATGVAAGGSGLRQTTAPSQSATPTLPQSAGPQSSKPPSDDSTPYEEKHLVYDENAPKSNNTSANAQSTDAKSKRQAGKQPGSDVTRPMGAPASPNAGPGAANTNLPSSTAAKPRVNVAKPVISSPNASAMRPPVLGASQRPAVAASAPRSVGKAGGYVVSLQDGRRFAFQNLHAARAYATRINANPNWKATLAVAGTKAQPAHSSLPQTQSRQGASATVTPHRATLVPVSAATVPHGSPSVHKAIAHPAGKDQRPAAAGKPSLAHATNAAKRPKQSATSSKKGSKTASNGKAAAKPGQHSSRQASTSHHAAKPVSTRPAHPTQTQHRYSMPTHHSSAPSHARTMPTHTRSSHSMPTHHGGGFY